MRSHKPEVPVVRNAGSRRKEANSNGLSGDIGKVRKWPRKVLAVG